MTHKPKHRHAKVLRWLADGEQVQFRNLGQSHLQDWDDVTLDGTCSNLLKDMLLNKLPHSFEFRIKPCTEQERKEFEAWALQYGTWDVVRDDNPTLETTGYTDLTLTVAWHAVQAARRAQVVPKEPTSKQVVLGAGALLGQPEYTADNRHPDWRSAVEKVRKVYMTMLAAAPQQPEAEKHVAHGGAENGQKTVETRMDTGFQRGAEIQGENA